MHGSLSQLTLTQTSVLRKALRMMACGGFSPLAVVGASNLSSMVGDDEAPLSTVYQWILAVCTAGSHAVTMYPCSPTYCSHADLCPSTNPVASLLFVRNASLPSVSYGAVPSCPLGLTLH